MMLTTSYLTRRQFLSLAGAAFVTTAVPLIVSAQTYPSRPITLIVPSAAGGPSDTLTRILTERMRSSLGQPIIIENQGTAGGSIAVGRVARAAPDGYTISIGQFGNYVLNGAIYPLPYDLLMDFESVALLASNPQVIVSKNAMPAQDLQGLISWLKQNPDKAAQGTAGAGSSGAHRWRLSSKHYRHPLPVRTLSGCCSGDAGFGGWAD